MEETSMEALLAALKENNQSGVKYVYTSGKRFQAKPYIRPGVQRSLGSFDTAREAAEHILRVCYEGEPLPPTPSKDRAKRGEGPRKRIRHKGAAPLSNPYMSHDSHAGRSTLVRAQTALICASADRRLGRRPARR
jgi:hypothetical protein